MESVIVSTELLYTQKKRISGINSAYHIDFWKEVKKRWLVLGVLAAVLLAVISPRVGAPGGKKPACSLLDHSRTHCTHPTMEIACISHKHLFNLGLLQAPMNVKDSTAGSQKKPLLRIASKKFNDNSPLHTEYLSYVPTSIIYFGAGARLAPRANSPHFAPPLSLAATAALHAHVAAPVLCACTVTMFGDALHRPVISGALLSSLGGGCAWLSLALSRRSSAALVAVGCYLASLAATPLGVLLLCGRTTIPSLRDILNTALSTLVPFTAGAARRKPLVQQKTADQAAALTLVYAECCSRLAEAEGSLYVGDVLATLFVEVAWVAASVGACGAYALWWGVRGARLIALCAVPKALDAGWDLAAACNVPALSRLPGVFAAPAQALLLAALHSHQPEADSDDSDWTDDD